LLSSPPIFEILESIPSFKSFILDIFSFSLVTFLPAFSRLEDKALSFETLPLSALNPAVLRPIKIPI
jgi:hypothetical protein